MSKSRDALRVTDHCVLRYLERGMNIHVETVRQHIYELCKNAAAVQAVCVRTEGLRFEITNNTVTTVVPDGAVPSRIARDRVQRKLERDRVR